MLGALCAIASVRALNPALASNPMWKKTKLAAYKQRIDPVILIEIIPTADRINIMVGKNSYRLHNYPCKLEIKQL